MIKKGIFHPQLLRILGELRHMDLLVIGDAGLPVPEGVERVDLGWIENSPRFLEVFSAVQSVLAVEAATFADEAKTNGEATAAIHRETLALLGDIPVSYVPHATLKEQMKGAKAIILTGEFTGYTNVILRMGCAY
ncbi:MAG: D-ribose pyranase [Eubacteriales bacterium]|nr:D-ribose pyranase [Eubacteriales bacterium]